MGAMGLMPAMPVRCSRAGFAGGRRLLPNWLGPWEGGPAPAAPAPLLTVTMFGSEGEGLVLGMTRAGGERGPENEGEPLRDAELAR